MNNISERFKNITIVILTGLALFLTTQLWFDILSNHNFFYFLNTTDKVFEMPNKSFYKPFRIINNLENQKYSIIYNNLDESSQMDIFEKVMTNIKELEFVSTEPINWQTIYSKYTFIYQYNFEMDRENFLKSLNIKNESIKEVDNNFTNIIIEPDNTPQNITYVTFVNVSKNLSYKYKLDLNIDTSIQSRISNLAYVSSKQLNLDVFENNVYIPSTENFSYLPISVSNPYLDSNGEERSTIIDEKVDSFFQNPASKNFEEMQSGENTAFTFSDTDVTVRYIKSRHILEYKNFEVLDTKKIPDVSDDFDIATRFIKNDQTVKNQFYLSNYVSSEETNIYYFDYVLNDFEIFLSNELKKNLEMDHHIEVTVKHGHVTNYKKATFTYEESAVSELIPTNVSYINFLDFVFDTTVIDKNSIKNLQFVYYNKTDIVDENYINIPIYWIMQVENRNIALSANN